MAVGIFVNHPVRLRILHGYAPKNWNYNEKHKIVHVFIRFLAKTAFESLV